MSIVAILLVLGLAVLYAVISRRKARRSDRVPSTSTSEGTIDTIQMKTYTSTPSLPPTDMTYDRAEKGRNHTPDENDELEYNYAYIGSTESTSDKLPYLPPTEMTYDRTEKGRTHAPDENDELVYNYAYIGSTESTSDKLHVTVQDIELVEGENKQDKENELVYNNAYVTNANHFQLQPNQCYGITTPSADPESDPVEGKQDKKDDELVYNNAYVKHSPLDMADHDYDYVQ